MAHLYIAWGLLLLSTGFALACGGAPERIAGGGYLVASLATEWALSPMGQRYIQFEASAFLIDLLVYAVFFGLVVRANRFWPAWIAAFQAASLLGYALGFFDQAPFGLMNAIVVQMWTYPILVLLAAGTVRHLLRARLYGSDPPWTRPLHNERSTA